MEGAGEGSTGDEYEATLGAGEAYGACAEPWLEMEERSVGLGSVTGGCCGKGADSVGLLDDGERWPLLWKPEPGRNGGVGGRHGVVWSQLSDSLRAGVLRRWRSG